MNDSLLNFIDSLKTVVANQSKDTLYVVSINTTKDFIDILPIIIAAVALILSFIATYISVKSKEDNRIHQRLSVVPAINYYEDYSLSKGCDGVGLQIKNVGIGPALIKNFTLSWGDIKINSDIDFAKIPREKIYGALEGGYLTQSSVLDKKDKMWIIKIPLNYLLLPNGAVDMEKVKNVRKVIRENVKFQIVYRSFYDEEEYELVLNYPLIKT
ncbi:MAG: hypothetical protein OQK56_07040 [Ignavibacteriaceae bacterium]|nr:hypothetical protein [Ignavibacteriaceae bacterium]